MSLYENEVTDLEEAFILPAPTPTKRELVTKFIFWAVVLVSGVICTLMILYLIFHRYFLN